MSKTRNAAESGGDWSDRDGDRDRERHQSHERKSLGHRSKVLKVQDGHGVGKHRSCDTDSGDDWLDIDKETHHGHRRKRSRYQTKETEFSDDQGESAHKLKENFHNEESDGERSNHRRGKRHERLRKRSLSGRENTKPDYMHHSTSNEDHESSSRRQCDERFVNISNDRSETSSLEEHLTFSTAVQSSESSSPGRYDGRSKSQDLVSKYCYDDKIDDCHWDYNEDAYEEHHNLRSKSTCDDKNQFRGKSNSDNDHSSELYNERRSRSRSQSSRERYTKCMKMETDSDEEHHEHKKN